MMALRRQRQANLIGDVLGELFARPPLGPRIIIGDRNEKHVGRRDIRGLAIRDDLNFGRKNPPVF